MLVCFQPDDSTAGPLVGMVGALQLLNYFSPAEEAVPADGGTSPGFPRPALSAMIKVETLSRNPKAFLHPQNAGGRLPSTMPVNCHPDERRDPLRIYSSRQRRVPRGCPLRWIAKRGNRSDQKGRLLLGACKGRYCARFVVFDVENGIELGDLQQVVHLLGEVEQLEISALIADGRKRADQLADS